MTQHPAMSESTIALEGSPRPVGTSSARIRSFAAIVADWVDQDRHRVAFRALDRDGNTVDCVTVGEFDRRCRALAGTIGSVAASGDRVLVPAMPGVLFQIAFVACLYAEVVAVPVPAIRGTGALRVNARTSRLSRLLNVCRDCRPVAAIAPAHQVEPLTQLAAQNPELGSIRFLAADGDPGSSDRIPVNESVDPKALAFLQYTSGSTAAPRGVMISNGALLANQQMIKDRLEVRPGSKAVSWLPPYHDMGLTTNVLLPLFAGIEAVLIEPETFMLRPELWLRELSGHPDVATAAPDFAYRFAAERVGADVRRTLDLRGWRTALTGAEPIRADTLRTFETAFAGCGFRSTVFTPAYGLAESTLFVSGAPVDEPPTIRRFDRAGLRAGRAVPTDGPAAAEIVGLGRPADGVEVVVTDPGTGAALMALEVGEVWVRSPSNGLGYWGQPVRSRATFNVRSGVPGSANVDDGWLRTGDLGFLDECGQIFVTGRRKETIIIRGANYVPQDFELLVQGAHGLLARGPAAAFVDANAPDRVVVVVEVDRAADRDALVDAVADGVRSAAGQLAVQTEVLAVTVGQIPRTTSGKVRRFACADRHRRGELRIICSSRDVA